MKFYSNTAFHKLVVERMDQKTEPMETEEMLDWTAKLPEMEREMKRSIRIVFFAAVNTGRVKRYLGQIRTECAFLLDVLYQYPELAETYSPLYQSVLNCLLAVMDELRLKYGKYLDPADQMPVYHFRSAAKKIEENIAPLVAAMSTHNADKTLQALLIGPMADLPSRHTDSWYRAAYLEQIQALVKKCCQGQPRNISNLLMELLLNCNFNTPGFIHYCKAKIEQELAECDELTDKYDCLFHYKRILTLIRKRRKTESFVPGDRGCYEQLGEYLEAQLELLDCKRPLLNPVALPAPGERPDRLPVTLSVEALTYFFRLLVNVGVVNDVKKCALVRFICAGFRTPGVGTANLTVKSVETKYRQVTNSTALTIKSILLKMIKQLDEDFGFY